MSPAPIPACLLLALVPSGNARKPGFAVDVPAMNIPMKRLVRRDLRAGCDVRPSRAA